jgi:hypothetical protein
MRVLLVLGSLVVGQAGGIAAQSQASMDAESLRAVLLRGLEVHKQMDIEFVRAIPDSAFRWAPTPGVRDFAQQIEHIIMDNVMFVARGVVGQRAPSFGDSSAYLANKPALERAVVATYDWVIGTLKSLPARDMFAETELFDERLPKWKVYLQALHHADWTRGQLVPYYRLNGTGPPEWRSY